MASSPPVPASIHATAVLVGARAALIRGPAGSGKSSLALRLIQAADAGLTAFARLVGDDRITVVATHGRLLIRPAAALAGLLEIRGLGIRRVPFEPIAVAGCVVELGETAAARMPDLEDRTAVLEGVRLPRFSLAPGHGGDAVAALVAFLAEVKGSPAASDCPI